MSARPPSRQLAQAWPSRRHRDHASKRDAIILAAARAFSRQGFHQTSLDDIARELGISKPTVYYYVQNKEQLLFECFRAGLAIIEDGLRKAETMPTGGRERLELVIRHYVRAVASDFGWCMTRAEDQDLGPELGGHIRQLKARIDRGLRALIETGIQDGSISCKEPKMAAFAMAGACNWIAHWYRENQPLTVEELADRFMGFFNSGLGAPPPR